METLSIFISSCITVFALSLLMITFFSYRKYKNSKLIFVCFVFLIFFIQGLFLSLSLFIENLDFANSNIFMGILDIIVLVLLFVAVIKR